MSHRSGRANQTKMSPLHSPSLSFQWRLWARGWHSTDIISTSYTSSRSRSDWRITPLFPPCWTTANIRELQDVLQREKKRIESLKIQRRRLHIQHTIADLLVPLGGASATFSTWYSGLRTYSHSSIFCLYALLVFLSLFRNISYR